MAIELTPWLTLFWLIPVTYIHLRREAEFRPVTAGVALPPEAAEDPEVYALQIQYRRLLFCPASSCWPPSWPVPSSRRARGCAGCCTAFGWIWP